MIRKQRNTNLDVLRGFAIILVLGVHLPVYPVWSTIGFFGVDLFFVLSGFLISDLLFREYRQCGTIALGRFFCRRALKLYPSFYFMLFVTMAFVPANRAQIVGDLLFAQNYLGSIWGHTWSLAVEEHFYLLLPLLLFLAIKFRRGPEPLRCVPFIFFALAIGCLGLRVWNHIRHPHFEHSVHYEPSHLRFDSLFAGVFIGYLHNFRPQFLRTAMAPPWRMPISLVGIAALVPAFTLDLADPILYTVGFTLLYIAFGILVLISLYPVGHQPMPGMTLRSLASLGRYSYTTYLWHVPMALPFAWLIARWGVDPGAFLMPNPWAIRSPKVYVVHALYVSTTIGLGVGLSKLIEVPILKMRDRLTGDRAPIQDAAAGVLVSRSQPGEDLYAVMSSSGG